MIKIIRGNKQDMYVDEKYNFVEWFNRENGAYIRSGVIEGTADTGVDPFMRSYPALIDVGVMGHCIHGKSGLCLASGVQCYQSGLTRNEPNMSIDDYESILQQSAGKVQQIAVGGRGDPNKHEQFGDILRLTREYGIIPNYTTSGLGLTDEEVALTKEMCGACAVSWYRSPYTISAIRKLVDAGITTNIHYVLGYNSIDEAIERLSNNDFPQGISAVVFLLHKPVGLGQQANVLQPDSPRVHRFFRLIDNWNGDFKIGFDSCSIPGIINYTSDINMDSIDTCEGARFSMYITPDMVATPCSFDQELKYGVGLRDYTIEEAWNSHKFEAFRDKLRHRCPGCAVRQNCMGGCPLTEVVLCNRKEKTQ